ncbi:TIGR03826 family flagellar region protein [Halalkalibacter krulwichiae]|uniref:Flagellar operon protein n=1 Tax=Halalkalibacter krulwichiae TaxID=199441 RepID=A0A1X9MKB8_9BACI|nr:TIGR03826 family flagellar region protein [Halalkalibacter krulwichiae]ARK32101.1 hypothetical protein BkAM31D_20905 [Halalkalibacter krulwichiae]
MKNVENCPNCGKIFIKALRSICPQCYMEQEGHFETVSKFMRSKHNRMATMVEVHEKTGVTLTLLQQFVREGRLSTKLFPNLGYPCESCGEIIQQGRICDGCKGYILKGLKQDQQEKDFQERTKEKHRMERTYHTLKDRIE